MSDREPTNWQSRLKEDRRRQIPFTDIMEDPDRPGTFSYFRITPERRVGVMRRMLRKMIPCYSDQNDQDRYLPERSLPPKKEMTEEDNDKEGKKGKKGLKKEERKSTTKKSDASQSTTDSIDQRKGGEGDKKKKRRKRRHGQKRSSTNTSPASAGGESDLRKLEARRKEYWKAGTMSQKRCVPHVPVPRDQWRPLPPLPSAVKTKPKTPRREFKPNRCRPSKEKLGQRDEIKGPKYAPTFARFRRRCENRFRLRDIRDHQMKMRFILRDEAKERRLAALANKTTAGDEVMPNQANKPIHLEEQKYYPQSDERADSTSTSPALHQLAQAVIQSERATRSRLERLELSMCRQHKLLITITKLLNRGLTQNLLSEECGPQPLALPQAPASDKVTDKDQSSSSTMKTKRSHKKKSSFNSNESSFSLIDTDKPLENGHPSRKSSHRMTYSSAALPSLKDDEAVKVKKTKKKKQHKKETSSHVYNRQPIEDSSFEGSPAIIHAGHEGIAITREHRYNAAADTTCRKKKMTKKKHEVEMSLQTENMTNESLATPAQISTDEHASFVVEERSTHIQRGKRMDERYEVNTYSSGKKHHNASTFLETTQVSYKMEYSTSSSDDAEQPVLLKKSSRATSKNRRVSKCQSKDGHTDSGSDEDFLDTSTSMTGGTGTNKTGQRVKKQTMSKRTTEPSFASSTDESSAVEIDYEKVKSNDVTPTRPAEERGFTSARARKKEQRRECEEPRAQITSTQMCKNFQAQAKCVIEEADEVGFISDRQQKGEMQKCLTSSSLDEDEEDFIATERDDYFVTASMEKDETKKKDGDKMETEKLKKKAKKAHKQASFGDSPNLVKMDNPMVDRKEDHVTPNETLKKKRTKKAKKSKELSKLLISEDDISLNNAGPSQMISSTKQKKARRVSDVARRNEEKTQQDVSDDDFPLNESEPTQAICSSTEKRRAGSFSQSENQEKQSKTNTVESAMSTNSDLSCGESELYDEAFASPAKLSHAKQSPARKQGKWNQDSVEIGKDTTREKIKTRGPKISSKREVATGVMSVAVESSGTSEDGLGCVISPKQREKRRKKRKPTKTAASSTPSGKSEDEVEDVSGTHFPAWCAKEKEEVRADTTITRKKKRGSQTVKEYESATGDKTDTISAHQSHEIDEHVKKHTKAVRHSPEKTKEKARELIALEMSEVQDVDILEEKGDENDKDSSLQDKRLKKEASQDSCDHTDLSLKEEAEKTSIHERSDDSKKSDSKNEEDFDEFCAVVSPTLAHVTEGRDKEQDSKTSENEHETDPAGKVESLSGEVMDKSEERKMDKEEKKRLKKEKRKRKKRNKESAGIENDEASADAIKAHSKKSRKKRKVPKVWKKFKHEQGLFIKKKCQKSISSNDLDETSADAERKIDDGMDSLNATSFNNSEEMAASGEVMSKKKKKKVKKEEKRRLKEKKLEEKKADGEDNGETGEKESDGVIKAKDKKTHKKHKAAKAWKKFKKEQGLYIKKKRRKQQASSEDVEVNPTAEDEKLQNSDHAQKTENKDGEKDSQGDGEELGKTEDAASSDVTAQSEKKLPSKSPKPLSAWKKYKHKQGLFRKPKMQPVSSKEAQQSTDQDESLAIKEKEKYGKEMEKREKKREKKQKKQARKEEKQKEKEEKKQKKEEQKIKKRLVKGGDNDATNDAESAPKKKNRGLVKFLKAKKEKQMKKSQIEPHASEKAPAEPVLARCRTVAPPPETSTVDFVTLESPTKEETVVATSEEILDTRADAKSTDMTPGWCDQVQANVYKYEDVQRSLQKETAVKNVKCADDVATSYNQHQAEDSEVARVHIEQDDDSSDGWFDAEGNTVVTNRHQENTRAKTESTSSTPGFTAPTSVTKVHQDEKILSQRLTVPNNDSAANDKDDSIRESEPRHNQRREIMHQILHELSSSDESSTQSDKTPEVLNDKTAPEMDIPSEETPAPTRPSLPCWLEICKDEPQIEQERGTIFSVKDDVGENQIFTGLPPTTSKEGSAEKPKDAHPHQSGRKVAESKEEVQVHPPRVECETRKQSVNEAASSNKKQVTDAVIEDIEDNDTSDGSEGKIVKEVFTKQPSASEQPESDYSSWDEESEEDIGQRKEENSATSVDTEMADELLGQLPPSGKQPADARKREDVIRKEDHLEETGLTELDVIEQMLQQSSSADLDIFGIVDKMPPCKNDTSSLKPKNDTVNSAREELNSLPKCEDKDEVVKTEKKAEQSSQGDILAKSLADELDGEPKAVKGKDLKPTNLSEQSATPSSPDTEVEKRKIHFSVVPRGPTITRQVQEPLKGILKKQTTSSASQEPNAELQTRAQAPVRFLEDAIKNTGEESDDLGLLSPGNAHGSKAVVRDTLTQSVDTKSHEKIEIANCARKQATGGSHDPVKAEDQSRLEETNPQRNNSDSPDLIEELQDPVFSLSQESSSESDEDFASPSMDHEEHTVEASMEKINKTQAFLDSYTLDRLKSSLIHAGKQNSISALHENEIPRYLRDDFNPAPEQKPFEKWNPVTAKKQLDKISQSKRKLPESTTPRWLKVDFNPDGSAPKREAWKSPKERDVLCSSPKSDFDFDCTSLTPETREMGRKEIENENKKILNSMRNQEQFRNSPKAAANHSTPSTPSLADEDIPRYLRADFDPAPDQKPFKRWNPVDAKKKFTKICSKSKLADSPKKGSTGSALSSAETPRWLQPDFNPATDATTTSTLSVCKPAANLQQPETKHQAPETSQTDSSPLWSHHHEVQPEAAFEPEYHGTVGGLYGEDPPMRDGPALADDTLGWTQPHSHHDHQYHAQHCARETSGPHGVLQSEVRALGASSVPAWLQTEPPPPQTLNHMPLLPGVKPVDKGLPRHPDVMVESHSGQSLQDDGVRGRGSQLRGGVKGSRGVPPTLSTQRGHLRQTAITPKWMQPGLNSSIPQTARPRNNEVPPQLQGADVQVLGSGKTPLPQNNIPTKGTLNVPALPGVQASKKGTPQQLSTSSAVFEQEIGALSRSSFQPTAEPEDSISSGAPSPEPPRYSWMRPGYGWTDMAWQDSAKDRRMLLNSIAKTQATRRPRAM